MIRAHELRNSVKSSDSDIDVQKVKLSLFIFSYFFILQSVYFTQPYFIDENDVFVGAMMIVRSGDVYKAFLTQHMPVMYYLGAIFYLLGARSVIVYRVYFAAFNALLWTMFYFRYSKEFGKTTMLLGPTVYLACLGNGDLMQTTVMADKLQAYGMAILLFEFLSFTEGHSVTKRLNTSSCCWISFAIFISFGSAFVAIYGIFMVFIGVLLIEIREYIRQRPKGKKLFSWLMSKYWYLILIVLAPFGVLLGWYALSGNLGNFIRCAYTLNRDIYSKYLISGYGSKPITVFFQCFSDYWTTFVSAINQLPVNTFDAIWKLLLLSSVLSFAFYWGHRDVLLGIFVFLIAAYSVPRGYFQYHAIAQYLLCSYMFAFLIDKMLHRCSLRIYENELTGCFASVLCIILLIPLFRSVGFITSIPSMFIQDISDEAKAIQTIIDDDEEYGVIAEERTNIFVEANRKIINYSVFELPWFNELYHDEGMQELISKKPKIILCNRNYEVWGYWLNEYAPDAIEYLENNYKCIFGDVWARNDICEEICNKLEIPVPQDMIIDAPEMFQPMPVLAEGSEYCQYFTLDHECLLKQIGIYVGTYMKENHGVLTIGLYNADSNELIDSTYVNISTFADNQCVIIDFPTTVLNQNINYYLKFTLQYDTEDDSMTIYRSADNASTESYYAVINGERKNYSLCVKLLGDNK